MDSQMPKILPKFIVPGMRAYEEAFGIVAPKSIAAFFLQIRTEHRGIRICC